MAKHQIQIDFDHYPTEQDLPPQTVLLLDYAIKALDLAYAPYSGFQVGAALLMANGEFVTGSNQENAAYPSGMCAERTAVYYAGSRYPGVAILELVVVARRKGEQSLVPACPCGSCRQALMEYEERQSQPIRMVFKQKHAGFLGLASVGDSLPFKFGADALGH
jgi:cytidine deaminase